MKKVLRIAVVVLLLFFLLAGILYKLNYADYGRWEIVTKQSANDLPWITFKWEGAEIGGRWVSIAWMSVPVTVENIPDTFKCQFDIGRDFTTIDGSILKNYTEANKELKEKWHTKSLSSWREYLRPLQIGIGPVLLKSDKVLVTERFKGIEEKDSSAQKQQTSIGTIGIDVCRNKVLIFDYPHNRLCIIDTIPAFYHTTYADITLDGTGEPQLKMDYKGKSYKILLDCGSSMFPLLVKRSVISSFSTAPVNDSFSFYESAEGGMVTFLGRPMKDSFTMAGRCFGNIEIYSSAKGGFENSCKSDAYTGNVLFLDKVIIVDFKHKKIGIL